MTSANLGVLAGLVGSGRGSQAEVPPLPLTHQDSGHNVGSTLSEVSGPFQRVIDCAGSAGIVEDLIGSLVSHGAYVSVGYTKLREFDLAPVSHKELSLVGVRSGRREDLEEIMGLVAAGKVRPPVIESWPLDDINLALRSLRGGTVGAKAVVAIGTEPSAIDMVAR